MKGPGAPVHRYNSATVRRISGLGKPDPWKDNGAGPMVVPAHVKAKRRAQRKARNATRRAGR